MNEQQGSTILTVDKKLDRVIQILEGTGSDNPGIIYKVHSHHDALYGDGKNAGVVQDVARLKQIKSWLIGTVSAGLGCGATMAIRKIIMGNF